MTFFGSYRFFLIAIACAVVTPSFSQNTKGDKPASNQRSILRIPKFKSKKKGTDKAFTKDIAGRRIRTKNKSSAVRAVQNKPLPYARRKAREVSRAGKPVSGQLGKFRSTTAQAARNNVYPNTNNYFVNNPSPRPHDNQRAVSNRRQLTQAASWNSKREPPGRKKRITPRSASSSFVTRGRKNLYWGKFSKGERPITTDITGRSLRAKNFHSPGLGVIPANDVYRKRKKYGDRPYKGTFITGYATSGRKTERAWRGDVSGHRVRTRPSKTSPEPGDARYSDYLSNSASGRRSNRAIAVRRPPGSPIARFFRGFSGVKTAKGGGSISGKGFNNRGRPVDVKAPGMGAKFVGGYRGFQRQQRKMFSQEGLGFSGDIKTRRQAKGGGSISGRGLNNGGNPVNVKAPGIGANMRNYRGNIHGKVKAFSQEGLSFAGNIRATRPPKGGGSISGRGFNNGGRPINVRAPGIGANMGDFTGTIKARRSPKGGGSISGRLWNNSSQPIDVKGPGIGAKFVGKYQGFFKATREPKGGGSVSGSWNNRGNPIIVKAPGIGAKYVGVYQGFFKRYEMSPGFGYQGETYKGSMKARRQEKGGGSISGILWNNHGNPIPRKSYSPAGLKVAVFSGNIKAKRPEKGGG
ncbi:MAG TPA: hypothetical protein VKQ08_11240, partial [Cyclobacteriaceae bacterium]|nr:hypothetical protein [Cyclobacteriaceae bacterium]